MAARWALLLDKPYLRVGYDDAKQRVRLERSKHKFERASDVDVAFDEAEAVLAGFRRAKLGLIVDQREAPLLPLAEVEGPLVRRMTKLISGFASVAVVVSTPTGLLELGRRKREGGDVYERLQAFTDEAAAMAALDAALPKKS